MTVSLNLNPPLFFLYSPDLGHLTFQISFQNQISAGWGNKTINFVGLNFDYNKDSILSYTFMHKNSNFIRISQ